MANELAGKVAIVTGASRGIGRGAALAFAEAGASVVVAARSTDKLSELVDEIEAIGGKAHASPVTPKRLGAVQQHGFFQVEKSAAWRGFHPAVQAVEHIEAAAKTTPAAAAAKGEQRQQAVFATKHFQPQI